jgi:hypothetical protein
MMTTGEQKMIPFDYGGTLLTMGRFSISFGFEPNVLAIIPLEIRWGHTVPWLRIRVQFLNFWLAFTRRP